MKPTVYLDATIPSFYYEDRPGAVMQAWREMTVEFWDEARDRYDCFVSDETVRELQDTGYPQDKREKCLALIAGVVDLAAFYVRERLMPADDPGDAFHLAMATWYRMQYLLTWNCKHLANANKFDHVEVLNSRKRLMSQALITPAQLLEIEP